MHKQSVREAFGANAAAYVKSPNHARGASLERLAALVAPRPEWVGLDVATATGHTALKFAPLMGRVWATDITGEMLALAKKAVVDRGLENVTVAYADAEDLPFSDRAFDLVTCRIAAHHFTDIPAFLQEARRVLRPGGILGVVDNVVPEEAAGDYVNALEKLRDPSHGRCLTVKEWRETFAGAGFSIRHEETLFKDLDFDFWAQRHDAQVQNFLFAMLSEVAGEAARFLRPLLTKTKRTFRLCEGIFIVVRIDAL